MAVLRKAVTGLFFLAAIFGSEAQAQQFRETKYGDVIYMERTDILTGEVSSIITVPPKERVPGSSAGIALSCNGDYMLAYGFERFFAGAMGTVKVLYRFDDGGIEEGLWLLARPDMAVLYDEEAREFVEKMKRGNRLVVRAVDIDGEEVTHEFRLRGVTRAIERLGCDS